MPMRTVVPVCRRRLVESDDDVKAPVGWVPAATSSSTPPTDASILGAWSDGARSCGSTSVKAEEKDTTS